MIGESKLDQLWKFLLTAILLVYACLQARSILIPLVFSGFLTIILNPIVTFLERKKVPTALAILMTIVLVIGVLTSGLLLASSQAKALIKDIPDLIDRYNLFIDQTEAQLVDWFGIQNTEPVKLLKDNLSGLISSGTGILTHAVEATSSLISFMTLVPIYIIFMLLSRKNIRRFLKSLGEQNGRDYLIVATEIKTMVYNYIGGLLIVISIISILNTIGLLALGIEHAIFLGILSGALTVLPYIGNLIGGTIPVVVALLTKDSLFYPIAVVALFGIVQFLEGNFITPKIIGSKVNINPLVAIIALLVGASIWGIIGMIIAIPSIGIVKIIFSHVDGLKPYATLLSSSQD